MMSKAQETHIIDVTEGGNKLATETLTRVPKSTKITCCVMFHTLVCVWSFFGFNQCIFHPSNLNPRGSSNDLGR